MGIKNWTVTVETVRSVGAREVYFENKDEPSHANSLSLTPICNGQTASMNMIRLCEEARAKQKAKRKGGRPPTPAVEFVFVLPSDLDEVGTDKQWQEITKDMIRSLAQSAGTSPQELLKVCRGSLHREPKTTPEESTKGNHLHLMVGKILSDGTPMPKLQQKKALFEVKQAFNASVLKHLGHSHEMYVARTRGNKKRFKNSWFKNNADLSRAVQAVQRNCTNLTKHVIELNAMRIMSTQRRLDKSLQALEELKRQENDLNDQQIGMLGLLFEQAKDVKAQANQSLEIHRETHKVEEEIKKTKPNRPKFG